MNPTSPNPVKAALRAGKLSIGSWLTVGHTVVAEIMAQARFEWLVIDLEHSVTSIDSVQPLIQVIQLSDCVPLIRLTGKDPDLAKRVMDAGAMGIIVPMVNTADEAESAVRSVKYPPAGTRSVGLGRAQGYGSAFDEYFRMSNTESLVIVQIEHRDAVANIDAIVGVRELDGVMLGPYDLSGSYGIAGQFRHPQMQAAEDRVLEAAQASGIAAGLHLVHPDPVELERRVAQGFRFIAYGVDILFLGDSARAAAQAARSSSLLASGR